MMIIFDGFFLFFYPQCPIDIQAWKKKYKQEKKNGTRSNQSSIGNFRRAQAPFTGRIDREAKTAKKAPPRLRLRL
jgi:hypothetical protein